MTKKDSKTKASILDSFIPPTITLGTSSKPENTFTPLAGIQVTLNQAQETYYRVGSFLLTDQIYTAKVPHGMTTEEYGIIAKSLESGVLVRGDHLIPPVIKASSVLEEYYNMLLKNNTTAEFDESKKRMIALYNRGHDRHWTAVEIFAYCLEREKKGKKRVSVISLLNELINNYNGPLTLYEPPPKPTDAEKVIISQDGTVTRFNSDGQIIDSKSADKKTANTAEVTQLSPEASALLDKLLSTRK